MSKASSKKKLPVSQPVVNSQPVANSRPPQRHGIQACVRPPQQSLLTEAPGETTFRVACVLRFMSSCLPDQDLEWTSNEEFGRYIILQDCAAALEGIYKVT
jgi:hypothetical protein